MEYNCLIGFEFNRFQFDVYEMVVIFLKYVYCVVFINFLCWMDFIFKVEQDGLYFNICIGFSGLGILEVF